MSGKDLKALTRHLFEEWSKGKAEALAAIDETCATNVVLHGGIGKDIRGVKDLKQYVGILCDAFPDLHFTIDDIVVEGDRVVERDNWTGTHKGAFMGIPPTNKKVAMWEIQMAKVVGGKIVELWARYDTLGVMQQLGVVPTPGMGK